MAGAKTGYADLAQIDGTLAAAETGRELIDWIAEYKVNEQMMNDLLKSLDPSAVVTEGRKKKIKSKFTAGSAVPQSVEDMPDSFPRPNGELYFPRTFEVKQRDGSTLEILDVEFLRMARERKMHVLMYGDPGTGKTALAEAAHWMQFGDEDKRSAFATVAVHGETEAKHFLGAYVPRPGRDPEFEIGPLPNMMISGGTIFVDEIALGHPAVMPVLYQAMDGRDEITIPQAPDLGPIRAKDGFHVVGACNPRVPGARLSEALLSRFPIQFEVFTDWKLAKKLGVSPDLIKAAQTLSTRVKQGTAVWAPQMRECLIFRDQENDFGTELALANLIARAPERERTKVAEVLTQAFGMAITEPLALR